MTQRTTEAERGFPRVATDDDIERAVELVLRAMAYKDRPRAWLPIQALPSSEDRRLAALRVEATFERHKAAEALRREKEDGLRPASSYVFDEMRRLAEGPQQLD